jgi:hypothetical protein
VELIPGDWVRDATVRVADDFVEANDAGRGGALHEFGDVTVHVVINMVVISRERRLPALSKTPGLRESAMAVAKVAHSAGVAGASKRIGGGRSKLCQ